MTAKEKIRKSTTIGSWLSSGSMIIADLMTKAGLDWLVLDHEHSMMDYETIQGLIVQTQANRCLSFVRVGANDALIIKKFLDAGADGVIVPMIKSLAEAKQAVQNVYYPTTGSRGVGLYRAQAYSYGFEDYVERHQKELVLIVQIEHIQALQELEQILQVPEIDGIIVGPYDLSASMGIPGQFEHPEFLKALKKIESLAKGSGKAMGVHVIQPEHQQVLEKQKAGYNFIAFSLDFLLLGKKLRDELGSIKKSMGGSL
ncbi:MAG: HpcH/HpaI aldolase/citrate lyase family protein [Pseudobdellovibrionaceae bacterium]